MNLHTSWSSSLASLLKGILSFRIYRPMGQLWYHAIFHFAGFHPFLFHLIDLLILFLNLFLAYSLARRLSNSREIALLAVLIGCYHVSFAPVYFDTGYIFDVLCYCFYFAAFLLYVRLRQSGKTPGAAALAACAALYVCALDSKEMAVTLPLALVVYELIYHPPAWQSLGDIGHWILREGRAALALGSLTLVFIVARLSGRESLLLNEEYRPVFTYARFMDTSGAFLNSLIRQVNWFHPGRVILLWIALLAVAWVARSRVLRFCWFFFMLAALPVAFVPPRGAPQYYIPWFGWVLYAATALVLAARRLAPHRARAPLLFAGVGVLLFWIYRAQSWSTVFSVAPDGERIRAVVSQLHGLHPMVPSSARFVFLHDSDDSFWGDVNHIVQLSYSDDSLHADHMKKLPQKPDAATLASYTYILDSQEGRLTDVTPPRPRRKPAVVASESGPEVFHEGFVPVTPRYPARPGEWLIARALDLGPTTPPVPPGQPFPGEPFATVSEPFMVLLNGRKCRPEVQIGWPGTIDNYRVDFRIPADTPGGDASLQLSTANSIGPAVRIPVAAR